MTVWSQLVAYKCTQCNADAIELRYSSHGADRECRACHYTPVLASAREKREGVPGMKPVK